MNYSVTPRKRRRAALLNIHRNHRHLHSGFKAKETWCRVVLIGSDEPLAAVLLRALDEAAHAHWDGKFGRKPKVLIEIRSAMRNGVRNPKRILDLIDDLQVAIQKAGRRWFVVRHRRDGSIFRSRSATWREWTFHSARYRRTCIPRFEGKHPPVCVSSSSFCYIRPWSWRTDGKGLGKGTRAI